MASCLLMLGMHEEIQEKVLEELKSTFQSKNDEVDAECLQKLVYLEMVIKETLRLFPIAAITGRRVSSDLQLDDEITLPKGANVFIRTFDVHRNPKLWGEDANEFKPERFLPKNFEKIHPYAYIPFSMGHRICIGHKYTMNVMKITLSYFLRHYRVSTDLKYDDIRLELSFILRIAQNYMIRIERRDF
jgi:cytochrome P450